MQLLLDEDLPRSLVRELQQAGIIAQHVLDLGKRGQSDDEILALARSKDFTLVTGDVGFGNLLRYPLNSHSGIVIARFPNELPTDITNAAIVRALLELTSEEVRGGLVIIEPGRVRIRRTS